MADEHNIIVSRAVILGTNRTSDFREGLQCGEEVTVYPGSIHADRCILRCGSKLLGGTECHAAVGMALTLKIEEVGVKGTKGLNGDTRKMRVGRKEINQPFHTSIGQRANQDSIHN